MKKLLSILLCALLCLSVLPATALAEGVDAYDAPASGEVFSVTDAAAVSEQHFSFVSDSETHRPEVPEGYTGIYDPEDFDTIRNNPNGNYILMNDIVFPGGGPDENAYAHIQTNFERIYSFGGIFDGNGYTLSNLYAEGGMFDSVERTGKICNLNVYGVICGNDSMTYGDLGYALGGIVNELAGTIENCRFDGQVFVNLSDGSTDDFSVGGIVGEVSTDIISTDAIVKNCSNYGDVAVCPSDAYSSESIVFDGTVSLGGIVGMFAPYRVNAPVVENCANYGNVILTVNGTASIGGIVGSFNSFWGSYGTAVDSSFNAGCIYVSQNDIAVEKVLRIGGVLGQSLDEGVTLTDIYNVGYWDITSPAELCAGGIVGAAQNVNITGAYCMSRVFHGDPQKMGGILGKADGEATLENTYFPELYPSARMDSEATEGQCDWYNLSNNAANCFWELINQYGWQFDEASTYPYPQLSQNPYCAFRVGSGSADDPYIVRNMQELGAVRYELSAHYRLGNDIICTTTNSNTSHPVALSAYEPKWLPIGVYTWEAFSGVFDGNGHEIDGITGDWTDDDYCYISVDNGDGDIRHPRYTDCYMGLFGSSSGTIENVNMNSYSLTADSKYITDHVNFEHYEAMAISGIIAGYNSGSIRSCAVKNTSSGVVVGGIVGENRGLIERCSTNSVYGDHVAGGIAAKNTGRIRECVNIGYIVQYGGYVYNDGHTFQGFSGGIVADNAGGSIENCYHAGTVTGMFLNDAASPNTPRVAGCSISPKVAGIATGGTIKYCYNVGQVNLPQDKTYSTGDPIGKAEVTSSVYALNVDGNAKGSEVRTYDQMKLQQTYEGFDFNTVWEMSQSVDYPFPLLKNTSVEIGNVYIGIKIVKKPLRKAFVLGEDFSANGKNCLKGGEYMVFSTDGAAETYQMSGNGAVLTFNFEKSAAEFFSPTEPGTYTVIVLPGYGYGSTGQYYFEDITIVAEKLPTGLTVSGPEKTVYYEGETFDTSGLTVTLSYNTEESEEIHDYALSPFDPYKIGEQTITVSHGEFSDTFTVEVRKKQAVSIKLTTSPDKLRYSRGYEDFDPSGGKITIHYNNGDTEIIDLTAEMVTDFDNSVAGKYMVTVSWLGCTDTFEVEIIDHLPGDLNGDGKVDRADVNYLLQYTIYPDRYPLNQDCDFTKDGKVDREDVSYLLQHTIYPERYPLG